MTFGLTFNGYYTEADLAEACLDSPGIYCVIGYSPRAGKLRVLYVGQGESVASRLVTPKRMAGFHKWLRRREQLFFAVAPFRGSEAHRKRVEAALIHHHKPIKNDQHVDAFRHEETTVRTKGANAGLSGCVTVRPTNTRWICERDPATSRVACNIRGGKSTERAPQRLWRRFWH